MDIETKLQLADYFTSAELVELVGVQVEDVIWMLDELNYVTDDTLAELKEIMEYGTKE